MVTFVRRPSGPNAERVERIKAVLQDDLDAPADTDLDLNPVGYFQVRWATTGLAANKTYRVQVSLPDGRVAGEVDVFLAARPRDLPTNVVGFVVGKNVQLRFRIDSDTVDRDHDTLLDWGDNCPDVPNHDQADADGDGLGDACDCPVADCPPNQRFDETTCGCVCAPCGPGHVIVDPIACTCGCDPRTSDPTCAGAPDGFVFDPSTCECACPDLICPAGRVADPDKCACVCAPNTCTGSHVQDPLTCGCACPQLLGPGVLDPCAGLGQGAVFDPVKCTCGCPDLLCPPGSVPDTSACACRAIVLGAPDAPLDLTTAAVSLDRPPTSEVCDGIATTELTTRLEVAKPATRTLSFASSSDTCPGSTSPNAKNHADAIALPVTGTPGMDVRLEVLGEASLLFDPECWLVVRGVIDGEVTYRAARHDGQASGGGTYLPADTAERAYVFCTDRAGLALPNTLEVFLTLTPR